MGEDADQASNASDDPYVGGEPREDEPAPDPSESAEIPAPISDDEEDPPAPPPSPPSDEGSVEMGVPFAEAFRQAQREESATVRWRKNSPTERLARGELAAALQAPFVRPILRFPLRKVVIWGSILALLYFMRQFFGVIFLTFVLTYIATTVVGRLDPFFSSRKPPVFLVYLVMVGAIVGLGFATIPAAVGGTKEQLAKLKEIEDPKAFVSEKLRKFIDDNPSLQGWQIRERLEDPDLNAQVVETLNSSRDQALDIASTVLKSVWTSVLNVGLALIFSFMLVWDMPRIGESVQKLETSRLGSVWSEVAPSVATFFALLGKAFEAQTVIAIVNTALTCVGMLLLGIDGIGFLATIVFVCSFIPIIGVFISTVPICIVALQGGGGLGLVVGVVVMVTVIHIIEAYVLNPRIYGYHMKLHPLVVLVVLYLAQHLFGFWGLIVAVPVTTYLWRHVIMGEADTVEITPSSVGSIEDVAEGSSAEAPAAAS